MSTYLRDRAFVLAVKPYREADAWISLWTESHGKQEVFAAGLRRTNARHQGHLQPFSLIEVMVAHGKVLDRIAVARMTAEHGLATRDSEAWTFLLGSLCQLCDRLTGPHAQEPGVFSFLRACVAVSGRVRAQFSYERLWLAWAFGLHALTKELGYGVSFTRCVRCQASPIRPHAFHLKEHGFLCARCDEASHHATSQPFSTEEALLQKGLQFLEKGSLEQVLALSAPRQALADLALILETTLLTLPVDIWRHQKTYLQSLFARSLSGPA